MKELNGSKEEILVAFQLRILDTPLTEDSVVPDKPRKQYARAVFTQGPV